MLWYGKSLMFGVATAPIFRLFGRGGSRPAQGAGWQAVATDEVEMSAAHVR
jgi:hypothetical protein